jgi:uncharacterized damage-inducible protein DinB
MSYRFFSIGIFLVLFFISGYTQETEKQTMKDEIPVFCQEYLGQIAFVKNRIIELEQAMPQETFTWRPMEGVRSVSEVYQHIANSNYGFPKMIGFESSGEKSMESEMKQEQTETTDKKEIADNLEKSFNVLSETVKKISQADLDKVIHVFGQDMTIRNFMISILGHIHEHLGQAIAYARMNKVVPPWTARQQQKTK